ncbi:MAG: pyrroline-5-carboxylate reductase [Micavibrio sp.]|nr:pyrroline-5-carboxylate reductase [Micavibrio sp.]
MLTTAPQPKKLSVALVGCGKMGGALLEGWLASDTVSEVTIIDPAPLPAHFENNPLITHMNDTAQLQGAYDVLMLATKPQIMDQVCEGLTGKLNKSTLILSIAAGKSISYFENYFGPDQPIIRTMPNTPAAIGKGITVACPNTCVSQKQKENAETLLSAGGLVDWISEEHQLNAVTALSGSGPAYIFYLIEVLAKTGEQMGLSKEMSMKLARQTVIGSAALAEKNDETPASTLRENVTSPGGTTQAALEVLMDGRLENIYQEALLAAKQRGEHLAK